MDASVLRALLQRVGDEPVLTLYLPVDPSDADNQRAEGQEKWRITMRNQVTELTEAAAAADAGRLADAVARVEDFLASYTPAGRTLVLVVDGEGVASVELPVVLGQHAAFGPPLLAEFVRAMNDHRLYATVLVDQQSPFGIEVCFLRAFPQKMICGLLRNRRAGVAAVQQITQGRVPSNDTPTFRAVAHAPRTPEDRAFVLPQMARLGQARSAALHPVVGGAEAGQTRVGADRRTEVAPSRPPSGDGLVTVGSWPLVRDDRSLDGGLGRSGGKAPDASSAEEGEGRDLNESLGATVAPEAVDGATGCASADGRRVVGGMRRHCGDILLQFRALQPLAVRRADGSGPDQ